MEMKKIIQKINELNNIKKNRSLTEEETTELFNYRKLYLDNFKKNVRNILDNTKVLNENGEDITPRKKGTN